MDVGGHLHRCVLYLTQVAPRCSIAHGGRIFAWLKEVDRRFAPINLLLQRIDHPANLPGPGSPRVVPPDCKSPSSAKMIPFISRRHASGSGT